MAGVSPVLKESNVTSADPGVAGSWSSPLVIAWDRALARIWRMWESKRARDVE